MQVTVGLTGLAHACMLAGLTDGWVHPRGGCEAALTSLHVALQGCDKRSCGSLLCAQLLQLAPLWYAVDALRPALLRSLCNFTCRAAVLHVQGPEGAWGCSVLATEGPAA